MTKKRKTKPEFAVGDYIRDTDSMGNDPLYGTITALNSLRYKGAVEYAVDLENSHPEWRIGTEEKKIFYSTVKDLRKAIRPKADEVSYYEAITSAAT